MDDIFEEEYETNILENVETLNYGDVIKLTCKEYKNDVFRIIYIDHHLLELEKLDEQNQIKKNNNNTNNIYVFELKEGFFYQNKKQIEIETILLLYRNPLQGYSRQQHFDEGVSLIVVFEKNVLIKGNVVKVVNDSITISTLTEGQLFFDFSYKGFPKLNGLVSIIKNINDEQEEEEVVNDEIKEDEDEDEVEEETYSEYPKDFIFSTREQQEDVFFDNESLFNLQSSLSSLSIFKNLIDQIQQKQNQNTTLDNDYLLIIAEKNNNTFSLSFTKDTDCLTDSISTSSLARCLKDELYTPLGLVLKPKQSQQYSLLENTTYVSLMAKSLIHLGLSFLPESKYEKQIIDIKKKFQSTEDFKPQSIHYVPKKPFSNKDDFESFISQVVPSEEAKINLYAKSNFLGQTSLRNIVNTFLNDESVNVNILQKIQTLLKKQNKILFYETAYQYDKNSENSKKNKLPRKSFYKTIFDRLLILKKQFDDVKIKWILVDESVINKEDNKEKNKQNKPTEFDVKQYFVGDTSKVITFTELFSQIITTDCGTAYTSFLALQNVIKPSIKEYIKNVLDGFKNEKQMVCEDVIVVSKSYQTLVDALADNDKTIFFDEKFYSSVDSQETRKEVEDGHFAIVHDESEGSIYMKRTNNKWEIYKQPVNIKDIILSNTKTFCELQPDCVKVNNDCKSIQTAETGLNETLLLHMQNQLNTEYHQTWLEILDAFQFSLLRLKFKQQQNQQQQTNNQNIQEKSIQENSNEKNIKRNILSYLNNKRLIQSDLILKEHWFVSKQNNIPYIPLFITYIKEGNEIKSENYRIASFIDDGQFEVDTFTGFTFLKQPKIDDLISDVLSNDYDFKIKIKNEVKIIYITDDETKPINWFQLLLYTFLPNASQRDIDFCGDVEEEDDEDSKTIFEKIMGCIFILLQTRFCRIEQSNKSKQSNKCKSKQIYKGFPFFTSDSKDNEGLKLFGNEFYDWLELKRDLLPFDRLKTYFEFAKNKKVFTESFCKSISLYIENNFLHHPVYLSKVFTFRKELKQKTKKITTNDFCVSNWQRFLPELSSLNDFKYQVSNFVLKKYVSTETLYVKSLLLSLKYQQFIYNNNNTDNNNDDKKQTLTLSYFLHLFEDIDRKLYELWFKSSSYIFYRTENHLPTFQYAQHFSDETIYRCFIKYCKFNNNCPLYKKLADICDAIQNPKTYSEEELFELETTESYNNRVNIELKKFEPIEFQIDKLKENGRKYNQDNLHQLLNFLHNQTKYNYIPVSFPTRTEALRKTIVLAIQLYPENETFNKINHLLDRFEFETEKQSDEEYKDLLHFTSETNNKLIIKILETLSEKQLEKTKNGGNIIVDKIDNQSAITFYKNFQRYFFVDLLKEKEKEKEKDKEKDKEKEKQIQIKEKHNYRKLLSDYDNLTLQMRNSIKLIVVTIPSCIINKHNRNFGINIKKYFDNASLDLKLKTIKEKGNLFIELFENTCCLSDESIFDIKLTKQLFGFYLLSLFDLFIDNELSVSMINDFAKLFFKEENHIDDDYKQYKKKNKIKVEHISFEEKEVFNNFTKTTII